MRATHPIAATLDRLTAGASGQSNAIGDLVAALAPDPTEFRSLGDMRDAVLSAKPPPPHVVALASARDRLEHAMTVAGVDALRDGRGFVFGEFDVTGEVYEDLASRGAAAFTSGLLGLPYATFTGLVKLRMGNDSKPIIIFAQELDGVDAPGMETMTGLRIYGVLPRRAANGQVLFTQLAPVGQAVRAGDGCDFYFSKPLEPPDPDGGAEMAELLPRLLFGMLMLVNDDRVPVRRELPSRQVNRARERRGDAAIPPLWRVSLADAYVTTLSAKQLHPDKRGGRHRSPVAHSRRGHQRRLPSGKLCWVKSCLIGELSRHLTRQRSFYRLDGGIQ